ncbi:ThiF family protein [Agreia bicolorata]|uniref:ThiF family protein n=1 Tax=Agreia bicolorata TaxID=110935 RepID=A0A1T4XV50_9MICO|nr:ThiF family adenylyltransferase [Agreia bicolorata]SKA93410.1 ThiF family protein [Agreia bicolorata]
MKTISSPEFSRNYGFWSEAEQGALISSRVAIGGVGGDGFQLGVKLARMGVGSFSVADPEVFETENVNRVEGAKASTVGRAKVDVFRETVLDINPAATVDVWREGVTRDNTAEFMHGAHLVFDESELTRPEIGTMIARQARLQGIPDVLVMNVGFAAQVMSFAPLSAWTFERFMGLSASEDLDQISARSIDLSRCLPYIPPYTDLRSLVTLQDDKTGDVSLPSISVGVDLASAIGSVQAFLHLTRGVSSRRRRQPIWAPRMAYIDAYALKARIVRASKSTHLRHLAVAAARQKFNRNPLAAYTPADMAARREAS